MRFQYSTVLPLLLSLAAASAAAEQSNYVERRSYGTQRETEPPRFVTNLNEWLDLGIEQRSRYEHRNNDFRRTEQKVDNPLLLRSKLYLAIKQILDPFRFTIEFQDSKRNNSQFARDTRDINYNEFIQGYGELYFKKTLAEHSPLSVRYGRMAFEQIDRRLIARNEWRNTTNTFEGARTIWGAKEGVWQLDLFSLRPIERFQEKYDEIDDTQWFHGIIADWRAWSRFLTLTPYYLQLQQDGDDEKSEKAKPDRLIHTFGLRGYGVFDESGFDYDFDLIRQTGHSGDEAHRAFAYIFEGGYTAGHPWKPRFSANIGVASGDRNPDDNSNQRFERLFGFARPWSNNDYFQMENIVAPKLRVELVPISDLRIDAGYSWYFLQSAKDRWQNANLRDKTGESGKNIGQEADVRVRYPVHSTMSVNLGYAYFMAGHFTKESSSPRDASSHFFYTELTFLPLKWK